MFETHPLYFWASIYLGVVLLYFMYQYDLVSIPALFASVLIYPALVPFITAYVYNVEHFTIRGAEYEAVATANRVVLLVALFLTAAAVVLRTLEAWNSDTYQKLKAHDLSLPYNPFAFSLLGLIALVSVYLIAPGPTILSSTYSQQNPFPWATFAGSLYKGAWALMFALVVTTYTRNRRYLFFLGVTLVGTTWLLLHGRRVESVGMMALLFADLFWHRWDLRICELPFDIRGWVLSIAGGLYGTALVVVGRVRTSAYQPSSGSASSSGSTSGSGSVSSSSADIASEMAETLQYADGFVGLPGGAHGTYGTMQATVHLFTEQYNYLYGETFVNYVVQVIPTPVLRLLNVSPPPMYHDLLQANYNWNGGNYILNVYFANFGIFGVLLAGLLLALLLHFLQTELRVNRPKPTVFTAVAALLFINLLRALWYTQLNWVDGLQGLTAIFLIYYGICVLGVADKRQHVTQKEMKKLKF